MKEKKIKILNAILFYVIWWGCILGIRFSYNLLGPLLAVVSGAIHLRVVHNPKNEIKLMVICGVLGMVIEAVHLHSGLLSYGGYIYQNSIFPPAWIVLIWMTLAATLNHSMFFLKDRWLLMVICGGVFGPLCYYFAAEAGILFIHPSLLKSMLILSAVWAFALPTMYYANKRIAQS